MWLSAKLRALQQMQQLPPQLPPLLPSCKCQRQRLKSRSHCARARHRRQLQHTPMCKVVRPPGKAALRRQRLVPMPRRRQQQLMVIHVHGPCRRGLNARMMSTH